MSRLLLLGIGGPATVAVWTPAQPTTNGGVLPHTWFYAGQAQQWEENTKVTPATDDGDPVGAATNQGSDGYDILQAAVLVRPTLKLNILNSLPIWRYDGGDSIVGAFAGGAISQPYTMMVVSQLAVVAVNDNSFRLVIDGDDVTHRGSIFQNAATLPDTWAVTCGVTLATATATEANWDIFTVLANGAASRFRRNGISLAAGDAGAHTLDGLRLGSRYDGTASFWIGDIAEVLIYASNLSDADKNQIGQYLATKYSLSWTDI